MSQQQAAMIKEAVKEAIQETVSECTEASNMCSADIGSLPIPRKKRTPVYCLSDAVDSCFKNYYDNLKGMTPAPNLYETVLEEIERPLIVRTLQFVNGNQVRAAEILGLNRNTLRKKIKSLDKTIQALTTLF